MNTEKNSILQIMTALISRMINIEIPESFCDEKMERLELSLFRRDVRYVRGTF